MGRSPLQEASPRYRLQIVTVRRLVARQGHRVGKSRRRGQAAEQCYPEMREGAIDQEREEGYCFRYVLLHLCSGGQGNTFV